jgi:hypothetical protein
VGEVGGNGLGDEVEDAGVLLAAGFDRGEHRLHGAAPGRALRAKGKFPPDYRMTQGASWPAFQLGLRVFFRFAQSVAFQLISSWPIVSPGRAARRSLSATTSRQHAIFRREVYSMPLFARCVK